MIAFTCFAVIIAPLPVQARAAGPIYVVQEGDSLTTISRYFHTSTTRLLLINYISDPNLLEPGTWLVIPGFEDLSGKLQPIKLGVGDTPQSLRRQSHSDPSAFERINFLTSADAVYVGQKLFSLQEDTPAQVRIPVTSGLTDLELAAQNNVNPWTAAEFNDLPAPWSLIANDTIFLPADSSSSAGSILPGIDSLSVTALQQGKTAILNTSGTNDAALNGSLDGYTLNFFSSGSNGFEALQGIPRMTRPGAVSLILSTKDQDGKTFAIQQNLLVAEVGYGVDSPILVADNFVDPKITDPENEFLFSTVAPASAEKLWSGAFVSPTSDPDCHASTYGLLRSLNGSAYIYFHSGIDFCGGEGTPIYAAADGVVVYAGEKVVRGNATIINHGHGVYTAYYHQSKIEVTVGQQVKAGEEIGQIGATGRVTGPHLHFEVLVGDVQVDPIDWLDGKIP